MTNLEEIARAIYEAAWGCGSWESPAVGRTERDEAFAQARAAVKAMLAPSEPEISAGEGWKCVALRAGQCRLRDEDEDPTHFRVVLEFAETPSITCSDVWNATPLLLRRDDGASPSDSAAKAPGVSGGEDGR